MDSTVHFRETQRFRQSWLWALLGVSALVSLANLARGKQSGREAAGELLALGASSLLLRTVQLSTEVRDDGIYVKFAPLHRSFRRIPFSDLSDVQATGYSPFRYGGWGIRWSPRGIAYTVSGRSGVRFERMGGNSTFVGSDRPDELLAAVQTASEKEI